MTEHCRFLWRVNKWGNALNLGLRIDKVSGLPHNLPSLSEKFLQISSTEKERFKTKRDGAF